MNDYHPIPFIPKTPEDALALDIARAFGDVSRLPHYRRVCASHERSVVYRAFREAMDVPAHQVRRSRQAIFFFILHANDHSDTTRA